MTLLTQPGSHLQDQQTGCFDASHPHKFTHVSLPLTTADSVQSPESNHTEAKEQEKLAQFRKTAGAVLLVLTLEQSKIMIPVTSTGTWTPGQSGHAHLHAQPISRGSELASTASVSRPPTRHRETCKHLPLLPMCSWPSVFIGRTLKCTWKTKIVGNGQ